MPETYKWVYRRPHGILGLADTYGFVSYCSYDPKNPSLFVALPQDEFHARLVADPFSVALHNSETNVFSRGNRKARESIRQMAAENDVYSLLQPGHFDPTFRGVDRLSTPGP